MRMRMKLRRTPGAGATGGLAGCGCLYLLASLTFWGVIIYVIYHFVTKYW